MTCVLLFYGLFIFNIVYRIIFEGIQNAQFQLNHEDAFFILAILIFTYQNQMDFYSSRIIVLMGRSFDILQSFLKTKNFHLLPLEAFLLYIFQETHFIDIFLEFKHYEGLFEPEILMDLHGNNQ